MLRSVTQIAVGVAIAALVLRTFWVMGLVSPVVVQGSSMAPAVWGERLAVGCPRCGRATEIGAETAPAPVEFVCPACRQQRVSTRGAARRPADAIWIDRSIELDAIDRWSVVVHRSPQDARELCVKRVLGLPGETVSFAEGDLWIDGERVVKSLPDQKRVRRLEHRETGALRRWRPVRGPWRHAGDGWRGAHTSDDPAAALRYGRPQGGPIYDDFSGNAALTRRLNAARDLMVEFALAEAPDAVVDVRVSPHASARVDVANRTAQLSVGNQAAGPRRLLGGVPRHVLLSVFDRRALLAVNGRVVLERPLAPGSGARAQVTLALHAGRARFTDLTIWKDVYYDADPQAPELAADRRWRLSAHEYFVAGDNQAISLDSRRWQPRGGVPRRLLIGRPLGVR